MDDLIKDLDKRMQIFLLSLLAFVSLALFWMRESTPGLIVLAIFCYSVLCVLRSYTKEDND